MSKIILTQDEMPFPDGYSTGNKVTKFRYRIVNSNRNQVSDWSVINYAEQDAIKYSGSEGIPVGGLIGQVPAKESNEDYDINWYDIVDLIPDGTYMSANSNALLPPGGQTDQVLTKKSPYNYDVAWKSVQNINFNDSFLSNSFWMGT